MRGGGVSAEVPNSQFQNNFNILNLNLLRALYKALSKALGSSRPLWGTHKRAKINKVKDRHSNIYPDPKLSLLELMSEQKIQRLNVLIARRGRGGVTTFESVPI